MIKINKEIEILIQNPNGNLTPQEFSKWNLIYILLRATIQDYTGVPE